MNFIVKIFKLFSSLVTTVLIGSLVVTSIITVKTSAQTGAITLDRVEGRIGLTDSITCARPIEFVLKITNNTPFYLNGLTNSFILYSPDGANWIPPTPEWNSPIWYYYLDGGNDWSYFGADGIGNDTIWFGAFALFEQGAPPFFSAEAFYIRTSVDCAQGGKALCLDSINGPEIFQWLWSTAEGGFVPTWDGPHCFTIGPCCVGVRGDFNIDGAGPNILDLTFLVDYLFRGSQNRGACPAESDVNSDGAVANILDLTFMVDYLSRGGPLPGPCL